jgi:hypothetical protein
MPGNGEPRYRHFTTTGSVGDPQRGDHVVTPINTATSKPGKLIKVPGGAGLIVITP